jgi:high-affinity nickel permease
MSAQAQLEPFLEFSARVTAFTVYELQGTGQAEAYLETVVGVVGEAVLGDLLSTFDAIRREADGEDAERDRLLRARIFSDERLGPVARNILKLWYVGTWYALPQEWHEAFGSVEDDSTFVVSAAAYTEGLVWSAIGANPPGAKGPGYGTWAMPPTIPAF